MITVADVIALALPPGTTVGAGATGLGREVTWASRIRPTPPAFGHLGGGELVLLAASVLEQLDERLTLEAAIHQLAAFGVAAVALVGEATGSALAAAEETGLPLLLLPAEAEIGPLERVAARLITERRRDVQRRDQEVFRRLMELAIAGEPLAGVVRALADVSGRAVILEGRDGRLLAYQAGPRQGPRREGLEPLLRRDRPEVVRWLRAIATSSPADPPTASYALDDGWSRVVAPVIGRDGLLGCISLVTERDQATAEDGQATARGAAACSIVLAREQAAATARREVELHVLDEVLDGALRSEATLLQQARRLGHDLDATHVALVLRLDQVSGSGPVRAGGRDERWDALGEAVGRAVGGRFTRALWRIRHNSAEVAWPTPAVSDAATVADAVRDDMAALIGGGRGGIPLVSGGIGTPRHGIVGIRRSHQEAKQALSLGRRLHGPGTMTRFDALGVHRLIFAAEGLPELRNLYDETLAPLLSYDREHNGDLLRTLAAFFAANGSPKVAAERLKVHRNTVLYRLDRVRDITGYDLDDADLRLRLHLALQVHVALYDDEERPLVR
ncbi:MAG: helix-turn-helix domain-containing protein [Chloroflexia bacterium]|nr:helix-turn-helix domain-containing protein [Chloroflexia bacterium]